MDGSFRICDVLQHESGLAWFTESIPSIKNVWPENIKNNQMGSFIEKQKPHFPEYKDIESKTEYHALTRGLIINEIVRRIDQKVCRHICTKLYIQSIIKKINYIFKGKTTTKFEFLHIVTSALNS